MPQRLPRREGHGTGDQHRERRVRLLPLVRVQGHVWAHKLQSVVVLGRVQEVDGQGCVFAAESGPDLGLPVGCEHELRPYGGSLLGQLLHLRF